MASAKPVAAERPRGVRRIIVLIVVATLLMAGALGSFFYIQYNAGISASWLDQRQELKAGIDLLTKISRETSQGLAPDFRALTDLTVRSEETRDFLSLIQTFKNGDPTASMPPLPDSHRADVDQLIQNWKDTLDSTGAILKSAETFQRTTSNAAAVVDALVTLKSAYEQMPTGPIATNQLLRLEKMEGAANSLTALGTNITASIKSLTRLNADFLAAHNGLSKSGVKGVEHIADAATTDALSSMATAIASLTADEEPMARYAEATASFLGAVSSVITSGNAVDQDVLDAVAAKKLDPRLSYALGGAALLALVVSVFLFIGDARRRVTEAVDRDTRQQKAILGLLDEITNLADGDLTVNVNVSEDFTGAIADSINYTVGSMRSLVGTINDTSVEIAGAASSTSDTARKMNQASERQAKEVANVTTAIVASSQQLDKVAGRAETLAQDAQKSVQVAHNGAETVNRTIHNMASLREQIQDTAKRIKRLGESSQEIGNIIEFINDIAEQTNTLALNASILAAMAGEQGRGFAVVADEVKRLAERAANATRQIENLVKTIQADTTEAIVSMERSTANVVAGAKSAEEAGQALTQVEGASNDLARLIQEISGQARGQSAAAGKIAGTMQVIRDIAVQTAGSASQTADAVGNLNTLSEKLRQSVSGFKLPPHSSPVPAPTARVAEAPPAETSPTA